MGGDWEEHLGYLKMNSRVMEEKWFSPFELWFNRNPNLFRCIREANDVPIDNNHADLNAWREDELFPSVEARTQIIWSTVGVKNLSRKRRICAQKKKFQRDSAVHVMIWDPESIHFGRASVREKVHIESSQPLKKHYIMDQLKICRLATMEMKDMESYPVDYIVDHKVEDGRHVYKVKWVLQRGKRATHSDQGLFILHYSLYLLPVSEPKHFQ